MVTLTKSSLRTPKKFYKVKVVLDLNLINKKVPKTSETLGCRFNVLVV